MQKEDKTYRQCNEELEGGRLATCDEPRSIPENEGNDEEGSAHVGFMSIEKKGDWIGW